METALVVLAAGVGKRMKSEKPKILHEIGGAPLLVHACLAGLHASPKRTVVVSSPDRRPIVDTLTRFRLEAHVAIQSEPKGTGHAVQVAEEALEGFAGVVLVVYGDTPLLSHQVVLDLVETCVRKAEVALLGFEACDPTGFGRLVLDTEGRLVRIVEHKDATEEERKITLCNSGVMAFRSEVLFELLGALSRDNAQGEYYLTDTVQLARERGMRCAAVPCAEEFTMGVNSLRELCDAEMTFQKRMRSRATDAGAILIDPGTVHFSYDTDLGKGAIIEPNVVFGTGVHVESMARIRSFSHLEDCRIGRRATVGPFARVRPGTELGEDSRIGNFVEAKAASIGERAKVSHLTYVGDARIGADTNIGAGTITCNYDGYSKHQTLIGPGSFVGSGTLFIAPVKIGDKAMTAAGSVINRDVPGGALGISRPALRIIRGFAKRMSRRLGKGTRKKNG